MYLIKLDEFDSLADFMPGVASNIRKPDYVNTYVAQFKFVKDERPYEVLKTLDKVIGMVLLEGGNMYNYEVKGSDLILKEEEEN